ncbi:MAG: hypothetical protein V1916_02015 [Patescibacteria group bacterium]
MNFSWTLAIAAVCAVACWYLIQNGVLRWIVPAVTIVATLANYGLMQLACENECLRGATVRSLWFATGGWRMNCRSVLAAETVVLAAVAGIWFLPHQTVHLPGVLASMASIPLTTFASGYLGIRSAL